MRNEERHLFYITIRNIYFYKEKTLLKNHIALQDPWCSGDYATALPLLPLSSLGCNGRGARRSGCDKVDGPMQDQIGLRPPRACRVLQWGWIGINRYIWQRPRVESVLPWRTGVDRETVQVDVYLIQEVSGGQRICNCHPASRASDGRPSANVDGIVNVVAARADVENTADAGLQFG